MHSQILVIFPEDVELEDVMYWYQEIDKDLEGKMNDERCQFYLSVPEEEIPNLLEEIKNDLEKWRDKYFEMVDYRSENSYEKFKDKYGHSRSYFNSYTYYCNLLSEYEKIKDLNIDNPKQIQFIKEYGYFATDADMYVKGKGYGMFHNPYQMWDYYLVVNEFRFPRNVRFLVGNDGQKYNEMKFNGLDIDKTIENINQLTMVWEHIIFCENDPKKSKLYSIDDIRFGNEWNKDCLLDNICCDLTLKDVLVKLQNKYSDERYKIIALDSHW